MRKETSKDRVEKKEKPRLMKPDNSPSKLRVSPKKIKRLQLEDLGMTEPHLGLAECEYQFNKSLSPYKKHFMYGTIDAPSFEQINMIGTAGDFENTAAQVGIRPDTQVFYST